MCPYRVFERQDNNDYEKIDNDSAEQTIDDINWDEYVEPIKKKKKIKLYLSFRIMQIFSIKYWLFLFPDSKSGKITFKFKYSKTKDGVLINKA